MAQLNDRQPPPGILRIGEPSLLVVVPVSTEPHVPPAALRRAVARALPGAAQIAARYRLRLYVRASTGVVGVGPDGVLLRGAVIRRGEIGYVLLAPGYPAVRLLGLQSDSMLADAAARYAALLGIPLASQRAL